jgi:hypothetical protein
LLDGRIELTGYSQGGAETMPQLTTLNLVDIQTALSMPGATQRDEAEAALNTNRKERIAQGRKLIAGWERVRNPKARLDQECGQKPRLAAYREQRKHPQPDSNRNANDNAADRIPMR